MTTVSYLDMKNDISEDQWSEAMDYWLDEFQSKTRSTNQQS